MSADFSHQSLWSRTRRRMTALVVLGLYVMGISGVPAGPGAISLGCQCDKILQQTGNCCCGKRSTAANTGGTASCCLARQKETGGSCCQAKANRNTCSKTSDRRRSAPRSASGAAAQEEDLASIGPCSCDSPSSAGYLLNTDPRVTSGSEVPGRAEELCGRCAAVNDPLSEWSLAPETPPPRA